MLNLSRMYGRLLEAMLSLACGLLLIMTLMIGADVLLRNIGLGGIPPSNELSEDILYLVTLLAAPALLRHGQHIRIDIVNNFLPRWLRNTIELIGHTFFLLPLTIIMIVTGIPFFRGSFAINEQNSRLHIKTFCR